VHVRCTADVRTIDVIIIHLASVLHTSTGLTFLPYSNCTLEYEIVDAQFYAGCHSWRNPRNKWETGDPSFLHKVARQRKQRLLIRQHNDRLYRGMAQLSGSHILQSATWMTVTTPLPPEAGERFNVWCNCLLISCIFTAKCCGKMQEQHDCTDAIIECTMDLTLSWNIGLAELEGRLPFLPRPVELLSTCVHCVYIFRDRKSVSSKRIQTRHLGLQQYYWTCLS